MFSNSLLGYHNTATVRYDRQNWIARSGRVCTSQVLLLIESYGVLFDKQIFCTFCIGWVDCRDVFHAFLHFRQWHGENVQSMQGFYSGKTPVHRLNLVRRVGKNSGLEDWGPRTQGSAGKQCLMQFYTLHHLYFCTSAT